MIHGKMTKSLPKLTVVTEDGSRFKHSCRGNCPDKYCGLYMPNQKEGMLPAARAAFMPMSDTVSRFNASSG